MYGGTHTSENDGEIEINKNYTSNYTQIMRLEKLESLHGIFSGIKIKLAHLIFLQWHNTNFLFCKNKSFKQCSTTLTGKI